MNGHVAPHKRLKSRDGLLRVCELQTKISADERLKKW